jgi:hypothetical protein
MEIEYSLGGLQKRAAVFSSIRLMCGLEIRDYTAAATEKDGVMRLNRVMGAVCALLMCAVSVPLFAQAKAAPKPGILHPADLKMILPGRVFFRGQSATTQLRNSGGVRFADGAMMLTALVDNGGYSSGIQQKYQAYLLTEVTLDIGGHTLAPGAYGAGFVKNGDGLQFVVMNIAATDLFRAEAGHDAKLQRPVPLEVLPGSKAGTYRLYQGRNYVDFSRAR